MEEAKNPIEVEIINGLGYVWNARDVFSLRREHRIIGQQVGSDCRYPRELTGLPLLLSPPEVQVLKEENVISLVEMRSLKNAPSTRTIDIATKHREDSYQKQIQIFKEDKRKNIEVFADKILEGKKNKLLNKIKKLEKLERNCDVEKTQLKKELDQINKESVIQEEVDKIQSISRDHQVIQIFTRDPWISNCDKCSAKWKYPTGDLDKCRLLAFRKLWKQGYVIGEGSKFGGDYLVYLGDPVRFHAKYILICQGYKSRNDELRPQELISRSRLGNQVRKIVLVANLSGQNDVVFTSFKRLLPEKEEDTPPTTSVTSDNQLNTAAPCQGANLVDTPVAEDGWEDEEELEL